MAPTAPPSPMRRCLVHRGPCARRGHRVLPGRSGRRTRRSEEMCPPRIVHSSHPGPSSGRPRILDQRVPSLPSHSSGACGSSPRAAAPTSPDAGHSIFPADWCVPTTAFACGSRIAAPFLREPMQEPSPSTGHQESARDTHPEVQRSPSHNEFPEACSHALPGGSGEASQGPLCHFSPCHH